MAAITVRNLSDETVAKLRVRAAQRGHSMEAEVREAVVALADAAPEMDAAELLRDAERRRREVHERVEQAQAMVREMCGGELPKGRVDAFLAERRAAAERGE